MFRLLTALLLCFVGLVVEFDDENAPPTLPKDSLPERLLIDSPPDGFSKLPSPSSDNPLTADKVALGRQLFFDPVLSKDGTVACASCHRPDHGFANSEKVAVGVQGKLGTRNVPTIFNRGYGDRFSWDGKSDSLEEQVLVPLTNPNELGNTVEAAVAALQQRPDYVAAFKRVFAEESPDEEKADDAEKADGAGDSDDRFVNATNLAKAIAAFERALIYGDTKIDRFRSAEYTAISRSARQGMWLFESRAGCWKCHNGENFTDEQFHNTGVSFGQENRDTGRFGISGKAADKFAFKTPTLRGVEFTAPYMHDGSMATLKEVVQFYNRGGAPDDANLDTKMSPLNLSDEEVDFLVEFLKALSQ